MCCQCKSESFESFTDTLRIALMFEFITTQKKPKKLDQEQDEVFLKNIEMLGTLTVSLPAAGWEGNNTDLLLDGNISTTVRVNTALSKLFSKNI